MPNRTKTFNDWLYSEKFAEPNHNRHHWMQEFSDMNQQEIRDYWLLAAWWAGYNTAKQELQTVTIKSRYGDLRHFVPAGDNLYRLDGEFKFCRMGGKQDQVGIDNNDLGFFDADGGPFIQEGYPIGTKLVKRIYLDNDKIMLEVD